MALFVFLLMLYVSQSAAVRVKVFEGDESVSLPFIIIPVKNNPLAKWTREGSTPENVHQRDDQGDFKNQIAHFINRTEMKNDSLRTGDLSLTLKNPNVSDSGVYTCVVIEETKEVGRTTVELIYISVKVTADEGAESVSLPCNMRPLNMNKDPSAQWTREGSHQVHLRLKEGDKEKDDHRLQSDQFTNRTQMNERALQTGTLSLLLFKTTPKDSGIYTCTVREGSTETERISVEVKIEPIPPPGPGPLIAVLVVLVLLVGLGGLLVWYYREKWRSKKVSVWAYEGDESVSLPCTLEHGLDMKKDPSVLWTRKESSPETVHYRNDQGDIDCLHFAHFKGRTEMKPDSLQTGNLSLILKKPTASDRGIYSCVVVHGTTKVTCATVELIYLRSAVCQVTVYEGDESVSLTFTMRGLDMNQDPSALWTREERTPETVHLRVKEGDDLSRQTAQFINRTEMKNNALQTGDLSLVLTRPTVSDTGTYICVVREGTEEAFTSVQLIVMKRTDDDPEAEILIKKIKRNASSVI